MSKDYIVYDMRKSGSIEYWYVKGFLTKEEAIEYGNDMRQRLYGYSASYIIEENKEGVITLRCSCWSTCD